MEMMECIRNPGAERTDIWLYSEIVNPFPSISIVYTINL